MILQKFIHHIVVAGMMIAFLAGCGVPAADSISTTVPTTASPLATSIPPTNTPDPTPIPPTETPIPRSTSVPGTKFEVITGKLTLELMVPLCNLSQIGVGHFTTEGVIFDVESMMEFSNNLFTPGDPPITPKPGDDVLCYIQGEVYAGSLTDAQLKAWVDDQSVYLLDQASSKSALVYAGVIEEEQDFLMLFSAPRAYNPAQLQMPEVLVDLP